MTPKYDTSEQITSTSTLPRLMEIDILRGFAIILVLFRHKYYIEPLFMMGWVGVDLFFVLSGYLVSGLLFKEYLRYGNIHIGRFLVRRGFKIYPLYYIALVIYAFQVMRHETLNWWNILADSIFIQNYTHKWGYLFGPSWSLAVEEHFYLLLCLILSVGFAWNWIRIPTTKKSGLHPIEMGILLIACSCLILRCCTSYFQWADNERMITMTHLRLDSLCAGVWISYAWHFKRESITLFVAKWRSWLLVGAAGLLSWTPFLDSIESIFVKTIGFTLAYIGCSLIVLYTIATPNSAVLMNKIFTPLGARFLSIIGMASYGIYVLHEGVYSLAYKVVEGHYHAEFWCMFLSSIFVGIGVFWTLEKYILQLRDMYFPSRKLLPSKH